MRRTRALGASMLALAIVAAACADESDETGGGSEASAEERQEYVDAIVAISESDDEAFTVEHRTCVAESFVDGFGVDEIVAAGVTPDDIRDDPDDGPGELGLEFSDEQAASFYDRLTGCMDVRALIMEAFGGDDLSQESVDCLDENLSDDLIERFLIMGFTQGDPGFEETPELEDELEDAVGGCLN